MDKNARRRLISRTLTLLDGGDTLPTVTVDEFFDGNDDEDSIGVNLPGDKHIGLNGFRHVLTSIRDRPDVQDVFLELTEVPDPDEPLDDEIWPTACVAFVVTSASLEDVKDWVTILHPRDVSEGWNVRAGIKTPIDKGAMKAGMRPVRVWLL